MKWEETRKENDSRSLSSDLEDDGADSQQHQDPADGDQEASVDRKPLQAPASRQDASQSLAGECLGQDIADIPGHDGHGS